MPSPAKILSLYSAEAESPKVIEDMDALYRPFATMRAALAQAHGVTTPSPWDAADAKSAGAQARAENKPSINFAELVGLYRTDARSPFQRVRHRTRVTYEANLRRIVGSELGNKKLADIRREDFERVYEIWKEGGKVPLAHGLMTAVRLVVSFGATVIEEPECLRLHVILSKMKLEVVKPREKIFSADWANDIRKKAHDLGMPSMALAQALQFDCKIPQTDVVGVWVPNTAEGISDVTTVRFGKWLAGVRWEEIDRDLVLHHVLSRGQEPVEIDLKKAPAVLEELGIAFPNARDKDGKIDRSKLPAKGPVIVNETTGIPYLYDTYRRHWRDIATAAGVPKNITNRFSSYAKAEAAAEQEAAG